MSGVPGADFAVASLETLLDRLAAGEGLAEDSVVAAAKAGVNTVNNVTLGVVDTFDKTHDQLAAEGIAAIKHAIDAIKATAGSGA